MTINKNALITGASSGFGKAIAENLASNGYNLILLARRKERLEELKMNLSNKFKNVGIQIVQCDVKDYNMIQSELKPILQNTQIDVLVNNAGLALGLSELDSGNVEDWDIMIDTNVKGVLYMIKTILPHMISSQRGYIINISSIAGKEVYPNGNVYCASKHALDAIGKSLRLETAKHNIKVTNINPGAAETEFSVVRFKGDSERASNVYQGFAPLLAQDIAETIEWLLSRPTHVNINEITIMPTAQPMAGTIYKK